MIIKLPQTFSDKEIEFIEQWYSEEGMQQLLAAKGKNCYIIVENPPIPGCKYVNVDNIPVIVVRRNRVTLKPIIKSELKTVKLLVLDEWINSINFQ